MNIEISIETHNKLIGLLLLDNEWQTYDEIFTRLLNSHEKEKKLIAQINKIKKQKEELNQKIIKLEKKLAFEQKSYKQLALKALETPPQPQMFMPSVNYQPQTTQQTAISAPHAQIATFAPPPPPPPTLPKKVSRKRIVYEEDGDVKQDYQKEIKQFFTGDLLKPSDVLKLAAPKHIDAQIEEIEKIPKLIECEDKDFYKIKGSQHQA